MPYYRTTKVLPIVFTILIIAGAIAALVSVARIAFFPNGSLDMPELVSSQQSLINTNAERSVKMTVRGPIVAVEDFRSYTIEITPNYRRLYIYRGYGDQLVGSKLLDNNLSSYGEFVYSLYRADFMKGAEMVEQDVELRGICATGSLFEFEILKNNETENKLWATSCSNSKGNLNTKTQPITKLFIAQIPEAQKMINQLWE